jgi:predicted nucleic acid-binding protein
VVDTDVAAAAILAESGTSEEATRLLTGRWELTAPAHWKAEFCNVLWKAVRLERIAAEEIDGIVSRVSQLLSSPGADGDMCAFLRQLLGYRST